MTVLVTGASGFLGRAVVDAFRRRGHAVRALVRPATDVGGLWGEDVEVVRGDLRSPQAPEDALEGVDAVVHLAADLRGDEEAMFAATVVGTERLLEAMARSGTRRLVLASSFAVYDWAAAEGSLTEQTPLTGDPAERGGYTAAKVWQERVARRLSERHGLALTVLRPGFVWGPGNEYVAGAGRSLGRLHVVVGGRSSRLPLTYVENCADCFVTATEDPRAMGETFNVVDTDEVTAWRYAGEYLRGTGTPGVRVPLPYGVGMALARLARRTSGLLFEGGGRLPSILVPARFEAQFKPLRFPNAKLREVLGWQPPHDVGEALRRTYGEASAAPATPTAGDARPQADYPRRR